MADQHPGAPPSAPAPAEAEDPLAADRRTLVIGAVAMVALILVGVVSAQLFARGGCTSVISPEPAEPAVAGSVTPADVVDEHLGPVEGAQAVAIVEEAAGAPVAAAFPVGEATGLAALEGGLVATGTTVTSFDAELTPVATFETEDVVAGDGTTIYDVTVVNQATGQADAFTPVTGADLEVGTCVDAALVGSPFAFLLDAGDGQLLLFRADEDGDGPHLELRDARDGRRWDARLTLPTGPPGTLAERLTAVLGPDAVVAARRVGPQEVTESPALVAVARDDGEVLFELDPRTLAEAGELDPALPIRWRVAAVGHDTVLVHGRSDPQDAPDAAEDQEEGPILGSLVLLDLADGRHVATVAGVGPVNAATVERRDPARTDRYAVTWERGEDAPDELAFLTADGDLTSVGGLTAEPRLAWAGDAVLVAGRDSLSRVEPGGDIPTVSVLVGGRFPAVTITEDGRVATLVSGRNGGVAVLLVTEPIEALAADLVDGT